jgi:hypothetical protein
LPTREPACYHVRRHFLARISVKILCLKMNGLLLQGALKRKIPAAKSALRLAFPKTPPIFAIPNGNNPTGD